MTADERMEHICTLSEGVSKCHMCNEKFSSQELALEHLKKFHNIGGEDDDDSSADEYVGSNASDNESESDGSSGVDENESDGGGENQEDGVSDNDEKNSKGRATKVDSEEFKKSRKLVAEYMEVLKTIRIPAKLLELEREL
jgi:hypothetical protein